MGLSAIELRERLDHFAFSPQFNVNLQLTFTSTFWNGIQLDVPCRVPHISVIYTIVEATWFRKADKKCRTFNPCFQLSMLVIFYLNYLVP